MVANVVDGRRVGFVDSLGQNRTRIRRVAKSTGTSEHVRECVTRSLHLEPLALPRSHGDIEVIRICSYAFHRSSFTPKLAADNAYAGTIIVGHLGDRTRRDILIARV